MNRTKLLLITSVVFLLGALASGLPKVKADSQQSGMVHVFIAPAIVKNAKSGRPLDVSNGHVVGISCFPKPIANLPDQALCYVATTP